MALGFLHHIGTFLLFSAAVLLIITCISAPVVHDISLLRVDFLQRTVSGVRSHVAFGTFGWCVNSDNDPDDCSASQVGYSPAGVLASEYGVDFSDYAIDTTRALTKAMVMHPIACGLNFIAFMLSLGAGMVGSLLASLVALLAFIITAVAVIIDFVLFSVVKSNVQENSEFANAYYGNAAWTILASAICSLLGTIIVFLTCCSGRLHKRRNRDVAVAKTEYVSPPRRRRHFWQRRSRI